MHGTINESGRVHLRVMRCGAKGFEMKELRLKYNYDVHKKDNTWLHYPIGTPMIECENDPGYYMNKQIDKEQIIALVPEYDLEEVEICDECGTENNAHHSATCIHVSA